jgi:hypothetical protein
MTRLLVLYLRYPAVLPFGSVFSTAQVYRFSAVTKA